HWSAQSGLGVGLAPNRGKCGLPRPIRPSGHGQTEGCGPATLFSGLHQDRSGAPGGLSQYSTVMPPAVRALPVRITHRAPHSLILAVRSRGAEPAASPRPVRGYVTFSPALWSVFVSCFLLATDQSRP